ncbi:sphingolipid long chain base-responsive protein PIL1 [Aspergillus bombycis]|uniref:Sphingolipid long chain base-responsive protein PIL1 n=1 Tax=Aspergillus bombycis TaxID=109264 RepID=A0A1F8AF65_9EURO|nr:sphingolipid long chain base-responsive protein PIL1 [Aspergillus bombycis]OGM50406.1 sphingolipid long chain base-responsive protein PIL1 [Aspergillus bombycis]
MNRLIKNENAAISAYEKAGRERVSTAKELSDWGEATEDEAVSDITDKLGVLLAEMGDQEEIFASYLEEYRTVLKHIRETENSIQPTRNHRAKIQDDIARLKIKDPESIRLETLEQELVRAEAQSLVAEAQLTNMTRAKLKEAFDIHLAAVIERGEKQILLARHARRLLGILDDSPVIPGEPRKDYDRGDEASQLIQDAERGLRSWESTTVPIPTSAGHLHDSTLLPAPAARVARDSQALTVGSSEVDGREMTASTRDINGSASDVRYTEEYIPETQGIPETEGPNEYVHEYGSGTQEGVPPVTEAQEFQEPVTAPVEPTRDTYSRLSNTITYIPGTKQRVDTAAGAEGYGESSTQGARGIYGATPDITGYTPRAHDTIPGTKEHVESVSAARSWDESVTDVSAGVNGDAVSGRSIDESVTDPTQHFDEPSTELTEGTEATKVTEATDDANGSIREKLQEQPQAAWGIPQTVAVPY